MTMSSSLRREVTHFQPRLAIDEAMTPPASWYTWPDFFERERETVFAQNWQFACPLDKVRENGQYVRVDVQGETYVILRDENGDMRGFHNVCRHHAAQLVVGEGCAEELVCPYHGWTYGLDGVLKSAPQMGAMKGFKRMRFALPPVEVEVWGPLVFFHPGTPERPFAESFADLGPRLNAFGSAALMHVTRRRYPMNCNWKVFVDNYLDGGYHIAHLHRGLASQLSMDSYATQVFDMHSVQTCASNATPKNSEGHDFKERIGRGSIYAFLYPNFMINRYGPIMDTNWVLPIDATHCEVVFDYWFPAKEGAEAERFIEQSLAASDRVQQEDIAISESVQRGLRSRSYNTGRYAPALEIAMHHFHRLLSSDLTEV